MNSVDISVAFCEEGDITAADIFNKNGVKLLSANSTVNPYILEKLCDMGIEKVSVYDPPMCAEDAEFQYQRAAGNYRQHVSSIKKLLTEMAIGRHFDDSALGSVLQVFYDNEKINDGVILKCIRNLKGADSYTYTHSVNTGLYSMLLAKWMGFDKQNVKKALVSGTLHDIGKLDVPDYVLNKKGRLTDNEFRCIRKHPAFGYRILNRANVVDLDIMEAVLCHHERIDRSGYPFGIIPQNIFARIVAVADVYDAVTSERPYKEGASPFRAFEIFENEGPGLFDSAAAGIFLRNISAFLIGSDVELNTGERGRIVYIAPQNILVPLVSVDSEIVYVTDAKGIKLINDL